MLIQSIDKRQDVGLIYSTEDISEELRNQPTMYQKRTWASKPVNKPHGYSDADWAGEIPGRKSTSGYVFMLNGAAVSWPSRR